MSSTSISVDSIGEAVEKELTIWHEDVIKALKKQARKSMTQLVKETKATAPVGHRKKHYKDSITSKKEVETDTGISYTWYVNGSNYRLSHLLEFGHASRNGGRVAGTGFITAASEPILEEYQTRVEEILQNGS